MQVKLQGLFSSGDGGNAIIVETNSHATVQTLVSMFCSHKGVAFDHRLGVYNETKSPLSLKGTLQSVGVTNGQTLYIGYTNHQSRSSLTRWPLFIAIFALVVGIAGILTMSLVYALHGGVVPFDYGIVMDAGSSKTNTLLYQWLGNKYQGTGCVQQIDSCAVKGGIAKSDPAERIPKILECTANVTKAMSNDTLKETPLYFASTAGMRLLNLSDPDRAEMIINELKNHLNDSRLSVKDISIISGRDEGIYAWITTNFLKDTLDVKNTDPFSPVTYGAMDMGGASVQIAFAVPEGDPDVIDPAIQKMKLYGENHNVFARSDLCFGRDEAARRYQALLIQHPLDTTVNDPCSPKGFSTSITAKSILDMPCTQTPVFQAWFRDYKDLQTHSYKFVGKSDYTGCAEAIRKMTSAEICVDMKFKECFNKLNQALVNQKFLAFASYFYTTDYLNLTKSTLEEYENETKEFCKKTLAELPGTSDYRAQYCFTAMYIDSVLIDGYGFNKTTWKNIEFVGKLDGKDVGWSLGYMINATNVIPAKRPSERLIHPTVLTIFLVIFIIVVAATIVYLFHTSCHKTDEINISGSAQSLYQSP